MSTEIVEEMIATLGLDSSKFTAGQKQVTDALGTMRSSVGEASESMGASLGSLATKFSGFFLGVAGLAGAIDLVKNMAFEMKNLDIQAQSLGSSFNTLRTLQEFSTLSGSPPNAGAQFAQAGISSLYDMLYGGIPQYSALSLWGLQPNAYEEAAKDPKAFYTQLAEGAKARGPSLANPFGLSEQENITQTLMAELHMPEGLANMTATAALSNNPAAVIAKQYDAAAADSKSATQKTADAAKQAADAMIRLKFQVENESTKAFPLLTAAVGGATKAFDELIKIVNDIDNSPLAKWIEKELAPNPAAAQNMTTGKALATMFDPLSPGFANLDATKAAANKLGQDWHRIGTSGNSAAWNAGTWLHSFFSGDTHAADIFSAAHMRDADLLSGMHLPGIQAPAPTIRAPLFAPIPLPSALGLSSYSSVGGSSDSHDVSMGNVTIHAGQATDAAGIAQALKGKVARVFSVGQADSGIVS